MLAVVVDDHDMGVTHVIRGDDHLNNAARQMLVYNAMGWEVPVWAHIPLIHGPKTARSFQQEAMARLGSRQWQAREDYPAAAMRNYLARLGWSHGDAEFFTDEEARAWFSLPAIRKSPARFDTKKLANLSGQHIAATPDAALVAEIQEFLTLSQQNPLTSTQETDLQRAMYCLKDRAKTYPELIEKASFILSSRPIAMDDKSAQALDSVHIGILRELTPQLQNASWNRDTLEAIVGALAEAHGVKLGKLASPLRAALSGRAVSPSIFDMMLVLGREETLNRLSDATA